MWFYETAYSAQITNNSLEINTIQETVENLVCENICYLNQLLKIDWIPSKTLNLEHRDQNTWHPEI